MSRKLFLGMTFGRRTDWEKYFAEVVATRSSKPDSVQAEIARKRAEREESAHFYPVAATVTSCAILDEEGCTIFRGGAGFSPNEGELSWLALQEIAKFLAQVTENQSLCQASESQYDDCGGLLFGLKIRDRLRIMAMDAMRYRARNRLEQGIPVSVWSHKPFEPAIWVDPYESLVPSERRNDILEGGLCEFLGIAYPAAIETDAVAQATVARELAIAANLFKVK